MEQTTTWKSLTGVEYTLKKLNFGEVSRVLDESQKIDPKTLTLTLSHWTRRLLTIKQGVVAPQLTDETIEKMTPVEGLALYNAINDFNEVPLETSPKQSSSIETSKQTREESNKL